MSISLEKFLSDPVRHSKMREAEKAIERLLNTEDDATAVLMHYYYDRPRIEEASPSIRVGSRVEWDDDSLGKLVPAVGTVVAIEPDHRGPRYSDNVNIVRDKKDPRYTSRGSWIYAMMIKRVLKY